MINFNSSKTKQKIAAVIVIVIVAAMVIGMVQEHFCTKTFSDIRNEKFAVAGQEDYAKKFMDSACCDCGSCDNIRSSGGSGRL